MSTILARHASGVPLQEIAGECYIAPKTVYRTVALIKKRLGAKNLVQAALIAHKLGYLSLPDEDGKVASQSPFMV